MKDIRIRHRNSKSDFEKIDVKARKINSNNKKEVFFDEEESQKEFVYNKKRGEEVKYTKEGKPILRAADHYDLLDGEEKRSKDPYDVLKRSDFFNKNKKELSETKIETFRRKKHKKRSKWKIFFITLGILIILAFVFVTYVLDKTTLIIIPKYKDVSASSTFLIFKDDLIVDYASSTLSKDILKSEPKEVYEKAEGEITIYNNYSNTPQVLITNTRFQSPDGKIFRISNSITVPGKNGDKEGSIKVKVTADTYGSEYNIGPTKFTIPGFQNTPRFEGFYAKSEESMTGGASGIVQMVSKTDIDNTKKDLTEDLESELKTKYLSINHNDYYTLYDLAKTRFFDNSNDLINENQNKYNLTAEVTLISIKKSVLSKLIAEQTLGQDFKSTDNFKMLSIDNLLFSFSDDSDINNNILKLNIIGKTRLIWDFDHEEMKRKFLSQPINNFTEIANQYKDIMLDFYSQNKPPWVKKYPNNTKKIEIKEVLR